MKNLEYQQRAVTELIDKTIRLLNAGGQRNKMVFEATTGALYSTIIRAVRLRLYSTVSHLFFVPFKLRSTSLAIKDTGYPLCAIRK